MASTNAIPLLTKANAIYQLCVKWLILICSVIRFSTFSLALHSSIVLHVDGVWTSANSHSWGRSSLEAFFFDYTWYPRPLFMNLVYSVLILMLFPICCFTVQLKLQKVYFFSDITPNFQHCLCSISGGLLSSPVFRTNVCELFLCVSVFPTQIT